MKKSRITLVILILLLISIFLVACGSNQEPQDTGEEITDGGDTGEELSEDSSTFIYAIDGEPVSLNPINTGDRWGLTVTNMIYSPLVRIESDGSYVNELAESVEQSEDGLTVTVTLKEDLKWSDGEVLTADDVIFTYQTMANKENGKADALWVGDNPIEFEKVDDLTINFKLPEPNVPALNNIVTEAYIMPEHIYGGLEDYSVSEYDIHPIGSGPYKLEEYNRGQYFSFVANENYYKGKANIDNIVFQIIENSDTSKVALQSGETHATIISPNDVEDMDQSQIDIYAYSENRVGYIGVNTNTEAMQDENIRKAVFFALNRDELNQAAYLDEEYYDNAYSFLPPNNAFATEDLEKYERDLDKSKDYLDEAGVSDLTIALGYTGEDPIQSTQAILMQQQLEEAGITLELKATDRNTLIASFSDPESTEFDLFINGYIMGNDPDQYSPLFTSDGSANFFHYKDEEIDRLFSQGAVELDENARKEIYNELQAYIADKALMFPLVDNKKLFASTNRLSNVEEAKFVPIYTLEDMSKLSIE